MSLNKDELRHYSRHLLLDEVGKVGQEKLKNAKVLLIGAGGLGGPAALYLGAAGVGHLGIIDFDTVDVSNLHRQVAFTYDDVDKPKAETLRKRLLATNPHIEVTIYNERFSVENARKLYEEYDVVVDGCDNFGTRYLSSDASFFTKTPLVFGAIHRFQGQMTVFAGSDESPCYRCLFPNPPDAGSIPNCAEAGVLGVLPGVVGTIQATEAIKIILQKGKTLQGRLMTYDAMEMSFNTFKLSRNSQCPLCGDKPSITELKEEQLLCPSQQEEMMSESINISVDELNDLMEAGTDIELIDVREEFEWDICNIKGAKLIPLGTVMQRAGEISQVKPVVIYCHHGMRSMQALKALETQGLSNMRNLQGGIAEWADVVDLDMEQY